MSPQNNISFVIPVYNERFNIPNVLNDIDLVSKTHPHWHAEVIVIEDGSSDGTRSVLMELKQKYPAVKFIFHDRNQGYTRSLKDGIASASGKFIMYIGADEEFDCSEIPAFVEPLLKGEADLVLGVRWQRNAYQLFRFFLSVIYIFLLNSMFKLRVNDYNWSQAWSREFLEKISLNSKSLFVLPEIIIKAHDLKYKIKEVPSNHRGRRTGKSSLNMSIMGHALWEGILFWFHRKSKNYAKEISANGTL